MEWPAHEVFTLCNCGDIEHCRLERYVSDVRIAEEETLRWQNLALALLALSPQPE